jgi:tripartite-type tricarboxylate transporter receptor subunit TctC
MRRAILSVVVSVLAASLSCVAASAETEYPTRPVQIVVPFVAGGNTDLITRIIADQLAAALHQPFTVVSKPGAGANIGAAYVAASDPDGYTLLMGPPGPLTVNQFLYPGILTFDPEKSFAPVAQIARIPNVLVVPASSGVRSLRGLIDKARANPGKLDYASAGIGSSGQLSAVLFMALAKIDMNHVPYKGTGQSVQDLLAGRVDMTIDNLGPLLPFIQSGQLIALGVADKDPVSLLPGVAPIGETVPGFETYSWNVLMAPAGTPRDIIVRLNAEANRSLRKPEVAEKLRSFGSEPATGSPEDLANFLVEERVRWQRAVDISQGK